MNTIIYVGEKFIRDDNNYRSMSIYKNLDGKDFTYYIEGDENNLNFFHSNNVFYLSNDVFDLLATIRCRDENTSEYGLTDETIDALKTSYSELKNRGILELKAKQLIKSKESKENL